MEIENWWRAARALPGGRDPLWRYGTDHKDDKSDSAVYLWDESNPPVIPWFPRVQLRIKYGTASFRTYTEREGLTYPWA